MLRKKLIIAGLIISLSLIILRAYFVFGSDFQTWLLGLILPLSQRGFVLLIGVGLIGLRWFLVHQKRTDNDKSGSRPRSLIRHL